LAGFSAYPTPIPCSAASRPAAITSGLPKVPASPTSAGSCGTGPLS